MKVISLGSETLLNEPSPLISVAGLTIGVFDGLHIGHKALIDALKTGVEDGKIALVTFDIHPEKLVALKAPVRLDHPDIRNRVLSEWGVDTVIELTVDDELLSMEPTEFIDRFFSIVRADRIAIGEDFRFGRNRGGDARLLKKRFAGEVAILPLEKWRGEAASSTVVRTLLAEGDLLSTKELIGRDYSVIGRVVSGDGMGRLLGYPTLNLEPAPDALMDGIYAVRTSLGDGVAHLGARPTLGRSEKRFEVHLFDDIDEMTDAYEVEVSFVGRIRGVVKHPSQEELVRQITTDVSEARRILGVSNEQEKM